VLLGFAQSTLAGPGGRIKFLLSQGERLRPDFILETDLLEPLSRRIVFVPCRLSGQIKRLLPEPIGQVRDLGGHPGEGRRIPFGLGPEIGPEPFQRISNRARRAAT
jgi:hypothetical protein